MNAFAFGLVRLQVDFKLTSMSPYTLTSFSTLCLWIVVTDNATGRCHIGEVTRSYPGRSDAVPS